MSVFKRMAPALLAGALLVGCGSSSDEATTETTSAEKPPVSIGAVTYVSHPSLDAIYEGLLDGLADAGYVEGENLTINLENPQADSATLNTIVNSYAAGDEDLYVAIATPPAQAMAQAISEKPVIFASVTDPVDAKVVQSMDEPGGNVTGTSDVLPVRDQIELLQEVLPDVESIGVVYSSSEANAEVAAQEVESVGEELGLSVELAGVPNSSEIVQAAESLDVDAYYVSNDNGVVAAIESLVQVAEQKQSLLFVSDPDSLARGAAVALATDYYDQGVQTAGMVVRVLEGEDTATMPVETQESMNVLVNQQAAERMGVTVPESVLDRAELVETE